MIGIIADALRFIEMPLRMELTIDAVRAGGEPPGSV